MRSAPHSSVNRTHVRPARDVCSVFPVSATPRAARRASVSGRAPDGSFPSLARRQVTIRQRHHAAGRAVARRAAGRIAHTSRAEQCCGRSISVCACDRPHRDEHGGARALFPAEPNSHARSVASSPRRKPGGPLPRTPRLRALTSHERHGIASPLGKRRVGYRRAPTARPCAVLACRRRVAGGPDSTE